MKAIRFYLVFIIMALCVFPNVLPGEVWRSADNTGINVLYCFLGIHGKYADYDSIRGYAEATGGMNSATSIAAASEKYGLPMQVVDLTGVPPSSWPLPLIAYMDVNAPNDGTFLLVVNVTENLVHYVSGSHATWNSLSIEYFRRDWSGFALVEKKRWWHSSLYMGSGFGVSIVVLTLGRGAFRYWRIRKIGVPGYVEE